MSLLPDPTPRYRRTPDPLVAWSRTRLERRPWSRLIGLAAVVLVASAVYGCAVGLVLRWRLGG